MSRLLVKNLPFHVTPAKLKEHFEQRGGPGGVITDFKVASKPDGTSRRFGFVGYKTDKDAQAAKDWFDKTFIGSTRIHVTIVDGAKDAPAPRPNKRPRIEMSANGGDAPLSDPKGSKDASAGTGTGKDESGKSKSKAEKNFDRYMEVMQSSASKGPSWANEASTVVKPAIATEAPLPVGADAVSQQDDQPSAEGMSDLDWMRKHMSKNVVDEEKVFEQSGDEMDVDEPKPSEKDQVPAQPTEPADSVKEGILKSGRLFLRNLAFSCTEGELEVLFKPYGEIIQVHIPVDTLSKQGKGLAYVTFKSHQDAVSAYEALDRKSFQGRLMHILAAVDRRNKYEVEEGEGRKKSLKEDRQAKKKSAAGKEFNWSMLYMNSDAVASSIADRMGVSKADILGSSDTGSNPAVKLALAETHVIQETKNYFESQGVLLSSFGTRGRSETTILVKNIPYGTTADQIRGLFESHGELQRVLVPPAGTLAVVEFDQPDEAAKAFKAVAYRRLGNSIIYLEKGPLGLFTGVAPSSAAPTVPTEHTRAPIKILEQEIDGAGEGDEPPSLAGGSTLFIKNLAFSTSAEKFTQMFKSIPGFSFARIQTKPDPKRASEPAAPRLSMGYGFVGFRDVESAKKALGSMQGFVLDGHALSVKFAGRGREEEKKDEERKGGKVGSTTTKMVVKNVPFEASKKDIRELFNAHGRLKSVRLPKKFNSRTRGFAFLEFISRREAENAYGALKHTHLLGRHLILEWAESDDEGGSDDGDGGGDNGAMGTGKSSRDRAIERLRRKTGLGYGDGKMVPGRKRKLDMNLVGEGAEEREGEEED